MSREHRYFVYLLTNQNNKVVYVGMTNNLERRIYEHKTKSVPGFTQKYNINKLVAIANPLWKDVSAEWFEIPHIRSE